MILFALTLVLMGSYAIPWVRESVGGAMDLIFGHLVDVYGIPFFVLIMILSAITGLYSSLIQKYTIDYEKMQRVQARMKEFQKEFREAQLGGDEKKLKKLEAKRDRMMQEQLELSKQQFKPMALILLLTVPIFFWLLFRLPGVEQTMTLPYAGTLGFTDVVLWFFPIWILWYMICSLAISQVIRKSLNIGGL
ncbi:MAG: EMC3/TMCO1 family protein [Methanofollis sp.]|nr:EMC3/TMCO1 family protein [Methanofollis sp.]